MVREEMRKQVFIVTGASGCGKTTTLEFLRSAWGYRFHHEAHLQVIADLGKKAEGHPLTSRFKRIEEEGHFCPMCNPMGFANLVLKKQLEIESEVEDGDLIERGYVDAMEYCRRNSRREGCEFKYGKEAFSLYAEVFLMDVVPAVQKAKWGKSKEERIREGYAINQRLKESYEQEGFPVFVVPPGSVEERARLIHQRLFNKTAQRS